MKITFLGTGTSQGVPVIGCSCEVCQSDHHKDKRLRTSLMVNIADKNIVIDIGPDFRQQMLRQNVKSLDAVLITHEHNDHIIGLDDIRPFYFKQKKGIEYYATNKVKDEIQNRFPYVFVKNPYPGAPNVNINTITPYQEINLGYCKVLPFPVLHGKIEVMAFRICDFAYITDASYIPEKSLNVLYDIDTLVINALRKEKHYSHFNLKEALQVIEALKPKKAFITHISHLMGRHQEFENSLPQNVAFAYDGLELNLS